MEPTATRALDDLRREALAAARGLQEGENALAGVLRDLEQERSRATQAYHAVLRSLAAALEARDGYTGEHSGAVHDLSVAVARRLGLAARTVAEVEAVAMLHDIGKIGIPDQILHKPGPLTADEWDTMRRHPLIGERILRPLAGLGDVARAVRHEHERWDGGGYPDGLAGETIPLASRIVLACDAYTAMVSDRPYRTALSADAARSEVRRCAGTHFDPLVVDALLECLDVPARGEQTAPEAEDVARALVDGGADGGEDRLARELHALIATASAVGAAHRLDDVVEVAAEQARHAVGAASLSVSRWEVQGRVLRTLVDVGDLGPRKERLPPDETDLLGPGDALRRTLEDGATVRMSRTDPGTGDLERELLTAGGREHAIAVPVMFAGRPWGALWATRTRAQGPFAERDGRFLETVAGQIAAAAGRTELFNRMAELALEDGLTGVANRRALDERLDLAVAEALDAGSDVAVLLCDLDNLKELNDAQGHQAGDEALARVATALRAEARDGLVARVGGDEFCVLLEGADADAACALGERVLARLASGDDRLTVSCGAASLGASIQRSGDLLRAADAAQYTAKRSGRARVCVADPELDGMWRAGSSERRSIRGRTNRGTVDAGRLLADVLDELDACAARPAGYRLETVAMLAGHALDACALVVSRLAAGGATIETIFSNDRRTGRSSGKRFGTGGEEFAAAEFPLTAGLLAHGGAQVIHAGDETADAAERALLAEYGMSGVLMAGATDEDGAWLVELYADARTRELGDAEPALRLLVAEAVRRVAPVQMCTTG